MLLEGFEGVYPAAVSPRDSEGGFSVAAFEKLIDRVYEADVNGLYVCGNTGEGYVMTEVEAPPHFVGKTLRDLGLRASHGVEVVLIKRARGEEGNGAIVSPVDYRIEHGDNLLLAGRQDDVEKLKT